MKLILAINPGSTSTKIGIYNGGQELFSENITHSAEQLKGYENVIDQYEFRLGQIKTLLAAKKIDLKNFAAIVGRGGMLKPMDSGTYAIDESMLEDLRSCKYGSHASNLGAIIAKSLAEDADVPAFIVDPVVVDELAPIARITGNPEIKKRSIFHALNQKAVAKRFAESKGCPYEQLNMIVCHMGGGISVGSHQGGRVVEVNNAIDGAGSFSPERAGTIPAGQLADLIIERNMTREEVAKLLAGRGGLVAHLGTNDARKVEQLIAAGDKHAELIYEAMIYNISRYIAAAAVPMKGNVDYILLTGGMAFSTYITAHIKEYVGFIAEVVVLPGEDELRALAEGAMRILEGKEIAKRYN